MNFDEWMEEVLKKIQFLLGRSSLVIPKTAQTRNELFPLYTAHQTPEQAAKFFLGIEE